MNRLKPLAAIAVLGLPLAACEETTPPPPVGSIVGTVSIEGTGIDGVSVNLSNGNTTTTAGGGSYRFDNVEGGAYTVTISGFPSDATFDATSAAATIASAGQSVTLNFTGAYIRTASVMGTVTVENMGLGGVTVALSGVSSATTVTDDNGQYTFTGLRMGNYSVEISGFNNDEIGFSATSSAVTVGTGESKIVSFDGTYLRTAGIQGQVSVEGVGLAGVNVSLAGGPDGEDMSTTTDAAGLYSFAKLRAGDYAVGISGFNTDDYEFAVTSQNVTIALGETANVPFDGILRRTSGIAGRVSVGGMGIADVTVTVSADGMDDVTAMTDATGQYAVSALAAGDYTVTISGYDAVEYTFEDSQDVTLVMDQTMIVNFEGTALRTASIAVSVTADDEGLAGAAVTVTQITGPTSGTVLGTQATDADGGATFGPLLAGTYRVDIAVDSDEIDFESTTATMAVATAEAATATFAGTINRTGSIAGSVTVDGEGMSGVSVMLSGGGDMVADTMMSGDDGSYSFSGLRKGDYTVSITNPDEARYEFSSTSESVSLAVGQEQSVSFAGAMTRSSSISGTVSVEGTGLAGVAVMLSGAASGTDTTDAAGGYAFTGLGAGTYTVAISGQDADAYVFETTSMEVMVGDNEAGTANFSGTHARTASVSGMLFVDEGTKNDMHDEGEDPFPAPGVPVVLVGPGVGQQLPTATDSTGAFSFTDLVAGKYQLVVPITPEVAMALGDYAYGGSATGYEIDLGVGAAHMQGIPFDITHTTVHFGVTLKSGEMRGAPLAGAAVTLYADAMGKTKVGEGMTMVNEEMHAVASIRIARAGTTGNTVYAGVAADSAYTVVDGMTPVMWDPKKTYTQGANANDIVNLNVDITYGGATITTEAGGGDALAGWAVNVAHGDTMYADKLDDDGMAAFKMTVDSAGALPAMYTISVDTVQVDSLHGGEMFEGTSVDHVHTGLTLAGSTMDAGTIEVAYTTQTLKVYVHHERDQVMGYTGNVLGGDVRASGMLDVGIRYINDAGRSRAFPATAKIGKTDAKGVVTFTNVPADHDVIAVADEAADSLNVMLLDPDELAAYTADDGATGGMFGENGGFSHTVELCPLMGPNPSTQDHDECGSFAFVSTHSVSGLVWKRGVKMSGDDFDVAGQDPTFVPGISVSLAPVEGKNLAGEDESYTSAAKDNTKTPLNETHQFAFSDIAAGVYKLSVPDGWRARMGGKGAEAMVGNALNPLAGDVALDVTPATATFFGRVNGGDGFPLDSVTVTANGVSAVTDEHGRYIVEGISAQTRTVNKVKHTNMVFVTASRAGFDDADLQILEFASNSVTRNDFTMAGTAESATVSGTVTAFGSDTPVAGVEIRVGGKAPMNPNAKKTKASTKNDIYVTGTDGTYTIRVPATAVGATATISAHKDGFTFTPAELALSTPKGSAVSGINFQAVANSTIRGRVQNPAGNGPLSGVEVMAVASSGTVDADTTGVTGTYSLSVPAGTYTMDFVKEGYSFSLPEGTTSWDVTVGLGQNVTFAQVKSSEVEAPASDDATLSALSLSDGVLNPAFNSADSVYTASVGVDTDTITVTATANDADADTLVIAPADADTVKAGHQVALAIGDGNVITVTVTAEDKTTTKTYMVTVDRSDGHQAPSAPTSLTVTPGDQSATVTWRAPRQIGSTTLRAYQWEASAPGQLTRSGEVLATAGTDGLFTANVAAPDNALVNGATYTFSVYAVNQKGDPAVDVRGPAATATAKAQPSITMAIDNTTIGEDPQSATDTATVTVTLSNPSIETITVSVAETFADDDEDRTAQLAIVNPTIVIAAGSTAAAATADPTTMTAIDDVVDEDPSTALVQATATNAIDSDSDGGTDGQQPATITITDDDTAPGAPRNLTVTAGDKQLTVEWISPTSAGTSSITHYEIRHVLTADIDDIGDAKWVTATSGVVLTELTNDSGYTVEVRAVSAAGDGTSASETGTPAAPGGE